MEATANSQSAHDAATARLEDQMVPLLATARGVLRRLAPQVHPDLDTEGLRLLLLLDRFTETTGRGPRGAELVDLLGVHKSSVSRGVTQLEMLGLLTRTPDPTDARAYQLRMTELGAESFARGRNLRHQEVSAALEGWSEQELLDAAALLERLIADLG